MSRDGPDDGDLSAPVPSAPTEAMPEGFLAPGQVLGDRYQIRSQLGRGGMGEVWRAFDLKLRVEVALKALLPDLFKDERRRDLLRREVRAAREVVSPNVCRIFDLIEVEGRELVSMEYVDGATLLAVLTERGPLELKEAQDIASQFLAGLEAIHQAGLVHRDVKPENIMITRAGRVVLMDFGLAKQEDSGAGTVSGTPAYMAPEQAAGLKVDARADVYSAGVVLAEMVSPEGIRSFESRQSVWEGIRQEPSRVPDSPWAPVLKKAVAKEPHQRYNSAHTLTRALEDVTLRVEGAEDLHPYPGLASFTEEDAEYFFGREAEVEAMWAKLEGPPRLLALVGPSGAGKTSFLRAGLLPSVPPGWASLRCTPGITPFVALGQAVAPTVAGDADAMRLLPRVQEPEAAVELITRWARSAAHALLIVDQFEELFTLTAADTQEQFAAVLARLPLEADVHVLVSMRDDFLVLCNRHDGLRPIVDGLTLLDPPKGANLRRALVQPAMRCGYRFEDDELIDEMLAQVEGERGALPLLAFAAAQLWERRDREKGLLTRDAYHDIGGVGGALARHAESTIDRIGIDRIAVVRELFRNLMTAEGTRAVREWGELLSVFEASQRGPAEGVLRALIDARLLTSYEVKEEDREPTGRVEIIHESLLANWPRLVRWQSQDADAALFRDQLRQAATLWLQRGRTDEHLWAGRAYREFVVWRDNYPGGLSETEQAFADATTRLATRQRRQRRAATAVAIIALLLVAGVLGGLWQRSERERRRAEAAKLLTLGRLEQTTNRSAAIAYILKSLELHDTRAARQFALEILWQGPIHFFAASEIGTERCRPSFSSDGRWLAAACVSRWVSVFSDNGGEPMRFEGGEVVGRAEFVGDDLMLRNDLIDGRPVVRAVSVPDGRDLRVFDMRLIEPEEDSVPWMPGSGAIYFFPFEPLDPSSFMLRVWNWPLDADQPRMIGEVKIRRDDDWTMKSDESGDEWFWLRDRKIYRGSSADFVSQTGELVGEHDARMPGLWPAQGGGVIAADENNEFLLWLGRPGQLGPTRVFRPRFEFDRFISSAATDLAGKRAAASGRLTDDRGVAVNAIGVWDLNAPPDAAELVFREPFLQGFAIHPAGDWIAAGVGGGVRLWPLEGKRSSVFAARQVQALAFSPDGRWLAAADAARLVLFPLRPKVASERVELGRWPTVIHSVKFNQTGDSVLVSGNGLVEIVPIDGAAPRRLDGFARDAVFASDFNHSGRLAAAASVGGEEEGVIRVWNLEDGTVQMLDAKPYLEKAGLPEVIVSPRGDESRGGIHSLAFSPDGRLFSAGWGSPVLAWDLESGTAEIVSPQPARMALSGDGRFLAHRGPVSITDTEGEVLFAVRDLGTGGSEAINSHGAGVRRFSIDPSGRILVSGDQNGIVRAGPLSGDEPHLLLGHSGDWIRALAISWDGQWIATATNDEIRLWPTPDVDAPPFQILPHDEVIKRLGSLTNYRVTEDDAADTGWRVDIAPFPGWATTPRW